MKLWEYFQRLPLRIVVLVLFGAVMAYAGMDMFLRPASPDSRSQLGYVEIDLQQLDYRLKFEDLQSAGMFTGIGCKKCDFSAGGSTPPPYLSGIYDYEDPGFVGFLYLPQRIHVLQLTFYGKDIPAGQQRLDQSLQALRAKFPGHADAIRLVATSAEGHEPVERDP